MKKDEIIKILLESDSRLDGKQIDELIDCFLKDAEGTFDLIDIFSAARGRLVRSGADNNAMFRLHLCAQRYLSGVSEESFRYQGEIRAIQCDEAGYFSLHNVQSACIRYANEVLDNESSRTDLIAKALGYAVDAFLKLGMFEAAEPYLARMEKLAAEASLSVSDRYLMLTNLMYGYAFLKNREKYEEYRRKMKTAEGISTLPEWMLRFCDLYALGGMAVMDADGGDDAGFRAEYERLLDRNGEHPFRRYRIYLIDQSFLLLPIFRKAWGIFGSDRILSCMEDLMKTSLSVSEKAGYYSWFFEDMGASSDAYPEAYAAYLSLLREYHRQTEDSRLQQVGDELLRHEVEKKYRKQAQKDSLTGLYNRYVYDNEKRILRNEPVLPDNLTVLMADLNQLKYTNDHLSHQAGDELICSAADMLQETLGEFGKIFRVGGDEFIGLLYGDAEELRNAFSRLRRKLKKWQGTLVGNISLSIGTVGATELPGMSINELIREAERRMYVEKNRFYSHSQFDRRKH